MKLPIIQPDGNAFALALRNLDVFDAADRNEWASAVVSAGSTRVPPPNRLIVELANTCNLDCPMCRVGEHGIDLRRVMPLEMFSRIIRDLVPNLQEVRINGLGESTLIPSFDKYLDQLEAFSGVVELITNGTGKIDHYRRLFARDATVLVSWDAGTPANFETLRRPALWDEMVVRLREIGRAHRVLGGRLLLLFTMQPSNIDELSPVIALAAEVGAQSVLVNVAKLRDEQWLQRCSERVLSSFARATDKAMRHNIKLVVPDHVGERRVPGANVAKTPADHCQQPWKEAVIRWDGTVQVCNMFNPYAYGVLDSRSFERIWNGAFASAFRALAHGTHGHPYCRGCYYLEGVYDSSAR